MKLRVYLLVLATAPSLKRPHERKEASAPSEGPDEDSVHS
jgi:hypothetical protein